MNGAISAGMAPIFSRTIASASEDAMGIAAVFPDVRLFLTQPAPAARSAARDPLASGQETHRRLGRR